MNGTVRGPVTADELARRHSGPRTPISAAALEDWLLGMRLAAVDADGGLHMTALAREVAAGLLTWHD